MKDVYKSIYVHYKTPMNFMEVVLKQMEYQKDCILVGEDFVMKTCGLKCDYCYCQDGTGGYRIGKGCPIYVEALMHSMENGKEKTE